MFNIKSEKNENKNLKGFEQRSHKALSTVTLLISTPLLATRPLVILGNLAQELYYEYDVYFCN